jgi:transposase
MGRKGKRTKGIEEAHPFAGMSQVNKDAAGVDIGAVEIVACVGGEKSTQIVKGLGTTQWTCNRSGVG